MNNIDEKIKKLKETLSFYDSISPIEKIPPISLRSIEHIMWDLHAVLTDMDQNDIDTLSDEDRELFERAESVHDDLRDKIRRTWDL